MTIREFLKLHFIDVEHSTFADEYNNISKCVEIPELSQCIHVKRNRDGYETAMRFAHYKYKGKVYKTLNKLLEVMP